MTDDEYDKIYIWIEEAISYLLKIFPKNNFDDDKMFNRVGEWELACEGLINVHHVMEIPKSKELKKAISAMNLNEKKMISEISDDLRTRILSEFNDKSLK